MLSHTLRQHPHADHHHSKPNTRTTSLVRLTLHTLTPRLFLPLATIQLLRLTLIRSLSLRSPIVRALPMLLEVCASTSWSDPVVSLNKTTIRHHHLPHPQLQLTLSSLSKHLALLKQQPSRRRTRPTLRVAGVKPTTTC